MEAANSPAVPRGIPEDPNVPTSMRPPLQDAQVLRLPTGESLYLWLSKGYPRIRPRANKGLGPTPTYSVFRLLLHMAWGPPSGQRPTACHFCCDIHGCCNPWHGRWGTNGQNKEEAEVLEAWRSAYLPLTKQERRQVTHPAATALELQGVQRQPR